MHRRSAGISFIFISAFLNSVRYLTAAIYGSSTTNYSETFFKVVLDSIGNDLLNFAVITLIVGIAYLLWAEIEEIIIRVRKNS